MIIIADYIGHVDDNKKPIGHSVKVSTEMAELLSENTDICIAAPCCHLEKIEELCDYKKIILPYTTFVFKNEGLQGKIKRWRNLNTLYKTDKESICLFINVDFLLFIYLLFHLKLCERSWIVLCYNPLLNINIIREKIISNILKRINRVIVTNKHFADSIRGNVIFAPDYYFDEDKYGIYQGTKKVRSVVSLGTTGETKQLEDFVEVMNETGIPVQIVGSFEHNMKRFDTLVSIAGDNVKIDNRYIATNEYYEMIAESMFVALPYDMKMYDQRTSGILLETMFMDSVPIAPKQLLEFNDIAGLGYENIKDIPTLLDNEKLIKEVLKQNYVKKNQYAKEKIINKILEKD